MRTCSSASSTSAAAVSSRASSTRCFGSEPELAPIRIGIPPSLGRRTTSSVLSGPPMLPGLMRTAATPASIALSASEALKWMSAMTGMRAQVDELRSASASSFFGTATRTTSQPAEASAPDLRHRRVDVVRLRERHRLHDDGRAAADRHASDPDLALARHRREQCNGRFSSPARSPRGDLEPGSGTRSRNDGSPPRARAGPHGTHVVEAAAEDRRARVTW